MKVVSDVQVKGTALSLNAKEVRKLTEELEELNQRMGGLRFSLYPALTTLVKCLRHGQHPLSYKQKVRGC